MNSAPRPPIPGPAVKRLCLYLRELDVFAENGQRTVSSKQLGQRLGLTDAQVRKDLAYFGQFGQPGIGYDVQQLTSEVRRALGTDRRWNLALIGAGNLGRALIAHTGFERKGFYITAVFDSDRKLIGTELHGRPVHSMNDLPGVMRTKDIRLGVIATPADAAQSVCDRLIDAGVEGVINFAPTRLSVRDGVSIVSVDLAVQLESLAFQVSLARPAVSGATQRDRTEGG